MMVPSLLALVGASSGPPPHRRLWTSLSQSRYGAQVRDIQAMQNGSYVPQGAEPYYQALGFLWTFPEVTDDARGLGRGIAWAWDDAGLCGPRGIERLFHEDLFFYTLVGCADLQAAMHRAFNSWADNHPSINFIDVSDECRTLNGGVLSRECELVEIWVTARTTEAERDGDGTLEAASARPTARVVRDFRYTNGQRPQRILRAAAAANTSNVSIPPTFEDIPVIETYGGTIEFGISNCWYLDSTFCSMFHEAKQNLGTQYLESLGQTICFIISGAAAVITALQMYAALSPHCSNKGTCSSRTQRSLEELSKWSVFWGAVRLVALVTPVLFYRQIFMPCFECYDFEAAATHEVGHILGLGHPDLASIELSAKAQELGASHGEDVWVLNADRLRMDNESCRVSFEDVGSRPAGEPVRPAIMKSFTQHNPRVCLEEDDLEALNTLYPDCSHSISSPVCFKIKHNIGWVRLGVYFLFPIVVACVFAIIVASITQKHQNKRLGSARDLLREKSFRLGRAMQRLTIQTTEAERARRELDRHKRTEKERVETEVAKRVSVLTGGSADGNTVGGAEQVRTEQVPMASQHSFSGRFSLFSALSSRAMSIRRGLSGFATTTRRDSDSPSARRSGRDGSSDEYPGLAPSTSDGSPSRAASLPSSTPASRFVTRSGLVVERPGSQMADNV